MNVAVAHIFFLCSSQITTLNLSCTQFFDACILIERFFAVLQLGWWYTADGQLQGSVWLCSAHVNLVHTYTFYIWLCTAHVNLVHSYSFNVWLCSAHVNLVHSYTFYIWLCTAHVNLVHSYTFTVWLCSAHVNFVHSCTFNFNRS